MLTSKLLHRHKWILLIGENMRYCRRCFTWQEYTRRYGLDGEGCWRVIPRLTALNGCANRRLLDRYFKARGVTGDYMSLLLFLKGGCIA